MDKISSKGLLTGIAIACLLLSPALSQAQQVVIPIETKDNALVLQTGPDRLLTMIYFGGKLNNKDEYKHIAKLNNFSGSIGSYNNAYTTAGTGNLVEPAIQVTHADGNKSLELKYVNHTVTKINDDVSLLSINLKDSVYNFEVTLNYKTYYNENVTEQWSVIKNREKKSVVLNKYASANLCLQGSSYWLKHYHGDWAQVMKPEEDQLTHGIKTLDSKLGTRADLFQPPTFMLSLGKSATEDSGEVMYGNLEWSGYFRLDFEVDPSNHLRLIAGINNYAADFVFFVVVVFV